LREPKAIRVLPSSYENIERCKAWYAPARVERAVEIGVGQGDYRTLFSDCPAYLGVDAHPGPGVDLAVADLCELPLAAESVDLVICGRSLARIGQFWRLFSEIARVLAPGGLFFMAAPSDGPGPGYRFPPDACAALAEWSGLRLIDHWRDERGPWREVIAVFQKGGDLERIKAPPPPKLQSHSWPKPPPEAEVLLGASPRRDALVALHRLVNPRLYVEIGVHQGRTLALASCRTVAIDPFPVLEREFDHVELHEMTSDDFFFFRARDALNAPVDLALIDGLHLSDFVYRDFMNLEPFMSRSGVIALDDVYPNHPLQAARRRQTGNWTGDVWRFADALSRLRSDLTIAWLDVNPTGLLVVSGFDPGNRALFDRYNEIAEELVRETPPPPRILERRRGTSADEATLRALLARARR
jgi:hypothetical protein